MQRTVWAMALHLHVILGKLMKTCKGFDMLAHVHNNQIASFASITRKTDSKTTATGKALVRA